VLSLIRRKEKGIVKPLPYISVLEKSKVDYKDLIEIYEKDEEARLAIDFFAYLAVGVGHYTISDDPLAKEMVDNYAEEINLDYLLLYTARDLIAFGLCIWERSSMKILPIGSQWLFERDEHGNLLKVIQQRGGKQVEFSPKELIIFSWGNVDGRVEGIGLLHLLASPLDYTLQYSTGEQERITIPSLFHIKAMIRDDVRNIIHYNVPKAIWFFERGDEAWLNLITSKLRKLKPGEALAVNRKAEITQQTLDPRGNYEQLLRFFENTYWKALQSPIARLFTTADFNRASAEVVKELYSWQILPFQRYLKRMVEREIYKPLLESKGIKSSVRLVWGSPTKPQYDVKDILAAVQLGVISKEEAREILMEIGWRLRKDAMG